jgi:hypothetical protein
VVIGEPIWVTEPTEMEPTGMAISSKRIPRQAVRSATERLAVELQRLFDEAQSRVG